MRRLDLNQAVDRYYQFVQRTVDVNRDLAISWAELVELSSPVRLNRPKYLSGRIW